LKQKHADGRPRDYQSLVSRLSQILSIFDSLPISRITEEIAPFFQQIWQRLINYTQTDVPTDIALFDHPTSTRNSVEANATAPLIVCQWIAILNQSVL
jgi:hypothetical protein